MRLRAPGALVLCVIASAACRTGASDAPLPPYLLDPRIGLEGPFPASVEEGWSLLRRGRSADAAKAFQAAGKNPAGTVGRIEALVESGRADEARAACGQTFGGAIETAPLLAACGEAAARGESWAEAFDLFEAAGLRSPDPAPFVELKRRAAPKAAAELVREGEQALADNEVAEAENAADRAIAIAPGQREALRLSGSAALAREDAPKAFARYRAAWKIDRTDVDSGEKAGDLALKVGNSEAGYEIFSALAKIDARFRARAEECQEEFVISNWPAPDRQSAHSARLTRAQAATLLWRLLPQIRDVAVPPSAPVASDILSRADQKILAHCLGIGLLTVDSSTHRARPDVFLSRAEASRLLLRAAALAGLGKKAPCADEKAASEGAAADCAVLPPGKPSAVSGPEFRRGIAAILASSGKARK